MKKLLFVALLGVFCIGCSDKSTSLNNQQNPTETPDVNDDASLFVCDGDELYAFPCDGGETMVVVASDVEYDIVISEEAQEWLTVGCTRSDLCIDRHSFIVASNFGGRFRSAQVEFVDKENVILHTIRFVQASKDGIIRYTTTDGNVLTPSSAQFETFGAMLVANTYRDGEGVLVFDDDITQIGDCAFADCATLATITLPDSITVIGREAFMGCVALVDITIPNSVTSIGSSSFCFCFGIQNVTIPDNVTDLDIGVFAVCTNLQSVTIGNGVSIIPDSAFKMCYSLENVTIPTNIREIHAEAFSECTSLVSITIPESVVCLLQWVFDGCTSLESVYCRSSYPPTGSGDPFGNNANNRKIYVPRESVDRYVSWWDNYADDIVGYDF